MFETIIWFVFRDSRVKINWLKSNPGLSLLAWFVYQCIMSLILVIMFHLYYESRVPDRQFIKAKLYLEIVATFGCLPFLIYKGFRTVNLQKLEGEQRFLIKNFLKSRSLEIALFSIPGVIYGVVGWVNIAWALYFASTYETWPGGDYRNLMTFAIIVDLLSLLIILIFAVYVLTFKIKGVLQAYVFPDKNISRKIKLT